MTENESGDREQVIDPSTESHDLFLQWLIRLTDGGLEMGVTLSVGGLLVTGTLIHRQTYFREFGELLGSTLEGVFSPSLANDIKQSIQSFGEDADGTPGEAESTAPWQPAHYVHLENARMITPGQPGIPTHEGVLWRGKVSAIDGFMLGTIGPPRESR